MKPGPAKALFPPSSGDSAGQSAIQARPVFVFDYMGSVKFGQISVVDPDPDLFGLFGSRSGIINPSPALIRKWILSHTKPVYPDLYSILILARTK